MENPQQTRPPDPTQSTGTKKNSHAFAAYARNAVFIAVGIAVAKFSFDALTPRFMPKSPAKKTSASPALVVPLPKPSPAAPSPLETVKTQVKHVIEPYELNGLYFADGEATALINNKIVQTGDQVDGATVIRIGEEEVELSRDDRTFVLKSRNR